MEDSFELLLEGVGYSSKATRGFKSGLDFVADFVGSPTYRTGEQPYACSLTKPFFSPNGLTAFSLKKGDFGSSDITELLEKVEAGKKSGDLTLAKLTGCVIVTNFAKSEKIIDSILSEGVHCWDVRRLIFYSAKAREIHERVFIGRVREQFLKGVKKSSVLIQTSEKVTEDALGAQFSVYVDDHDISLDIDSTFVKTVLAEIHDHTLKPIVDSTDLDVQAFVRFHFLGIANENLVAKAFREYAQESASKRVTFMGPPNVFQYGAAPWRTLFQF